MGSGGYHSLSVCKKNLRINFFAHFVKYFKLDEMPHVCIKLKLNKYPLAPMGVLAPGSAHAIPSAQPPIDTSGKFPAHMSAESSSNISPNPFEVISEVSEP